MRVAGGAAFFAAGALKAARNAVATSLPFFTYRSTTAWRFSILSLLSSANFSASALSAAASESATFFCSAPIAATASSSDASGPRPRAERIFSIFGFPSLSSTLTLPELSRLRTQETGRFGRLVSATESRPSTSPRSLRSNTGDTNRYWRELTAAAPSSVNMKSAKSPPSSTRRFFAQA